MHYGLDSKGETSQCVVIIATYYCCRHGHKKSSNMQLNEENHDIWVEPALKGTPCLF